MRTIFWIRFCFLLLLPTFFLETNNLHFFLLFVGNCHPAFLIQAIDSVFPSHLPESDSPSYFSTAAPEELLAPQDDGAGT